MNRYKHEDRFRQLGINIAHYRKLNNLKQVELAAAANISRGHLSRIESPNTTDKSFSIATVFDIAEALEVEPALLFAYTDLSNHNQ